MIGKITGLARALAIILAVVAGVVVMPDLNVSLILVILGLIAGMKYCDDTATSLILTALVLPVVGTVLGLIPEVGDRLSGIANGLAIAATAAVATMLACRLFKMVKGDLTGLTAKD